MGLAVISPLLGSADIGGQLGDQAIGWAMGPQQLLGSLEADAQRMLVTQHALGKLRNEVVEVGSCRTVRLFKALSHG
jgi:hypothetical protein